MSFSALGLSKLLLDAVAAEGYSDPTPIQREAIPHVLKGSDLVALAQTGTGKTAAFALPILERLLAHRAKKGIRVLVLSPTRELASQIQDGFVRYGRGSQIKSTVIFGGVGSGLYGMLMFVIVAVFVIVIVIIVVFVIIIIIFVAILIAATVVVVITVVVDGDGYAAAVVCSSWFTKYNFACTCYSVVGRNESEFRVDVVIHPDGL
jgi:hypothetical protein